MSEATLEVPATTKGNTWLGKDKFLKAFLIHSIGGRTPKGAVHDGHDAYQTVMDKPWDMNKKKFVLESVAMNAGKAMGVQGLLRSAEEMWNALSG